MSIRPVSVNSIVFNNLKH